MWLRLWTYVKLFREELLVVFIAARNPYTPRYIKLLLLSVLGYLLLPVDLVPDYIPVLGLVDDFTLVPAALLYITKLLPEHIRRDSRLKAVDMGRKIPYIVAAITALAIVWTVFLIWGLYRLITG